MTSGRRYRGSISSRPAQIVSLLHDTEEPALQRISGAAINANAYSEQLPAAGVAWSIPIWVGNAHRAVDLRSAMHEGFLVSLVHYNLDRSESDVCLGNSNACQPCERYSNQRARNEASSRSGASPAVVVSDGVDCRRSWQRASSGTRGQIW